mmetsp:Transcript_72875/g.189728  ORF Transcript_72875/g.189728 Transcript_72875/m.189728 type:complete len:82 (+) Transcript_72875:800-1045(+)
MVPLLWGSKLHGRWRGGTTLLPSGHSRKKFGLCPGTTTLYRAVGEVIPSGLPRGPGGLHIAGAALRDAFGPCCVCGLRRHH